MCGIWTDWKSGYPSEVGKTYLKLVIRVMVLPSQQETVRAQSLRTIVTGIKSTCTSTKFSILNIQESLGLPWQSSG